MSKCFRDLGPLDFFDHRAYLFSLYDCLEEHCRFSADSTIIKQKYVCTILMIKKSLVISQIPGMFIYDGLRIYITNEYFRPLCYSGYYKEREEWTNREEKNERETEKKRGRRGRRK